MADLMERLLDAHHNRQQNVLGSEIFLEAASEIRKHQQTINDMAMLMKMLLSERSAERKAKEYLTQNGLMGSPLRDS